MALVKPIVSPWGQTYAAAYHMIGAVQDQRVGRSLTFATVSFRDAAMRDEVKAATAAFEAAWADYTAKSAAHDAAPQGDAREQTYLDMVAAKLAAQRARDAVEALKPLPLAGDQYSLTGPDYAAALDATGAVDIEKLYVWLKTQPKWLDSTDI